MDKPKFRLKRGFGAVYPTVGWIRARDNAWNVVKILKPSEIKPSLAGFREIDGIFCVIFKSQRDGKFYAQDYETARE